MNPITKLFKAVCLASVLATPLLAQETNNLGIFEGATDVGTVAKKGSVVFNSARGEYRVTGGGDNMWGARDDFYFLWRKLDGDTALTATVRFEGKGSEPHRKVALMIRKDLDPGSPQVNATVHVNGLTALQFRETTNDITRSVSFPVDGPVRLRLERRGSSYTVFAAKEDQPLTEFGSIQVAMSGPAYVGLAVCPHDARGEMTAVFSDVTFEKPGKAVSRQKN